MNIRLGACRKGASEKIKAVAQDRKQARSRTRQHELARPTLEQLATAYLFQQADLVADRCRRHAELHRFGLEAAVPSDGLDGMQGAQGRTVSHVSSVDEFLSSSS
ncbi:hypothetical protein J2W42_006573 [Rhizobium tibeticum]|nr:hypothetical protein [Rhizobium tibeticum]MDP9813698.1 hypothetical protein [Rhizobium tibeticum]